MHIQNRARKLLNLVDTGHLTYGEAHAAALAISTQNDLRAKDAELTEAGAKAIGEVVVDAIKRAEGGGERVEAERIRNITGVVGTDYFRLIHDAHEKATKVWLLKDMDADHVTAWFKGGTTDESNCEMLCIPHNRSKGNR